MMVDPANNNYLAYLIELGHNDGAGLVNAHSHYGNSWKKRGGIGAFMMLARKWDRLEKFLSEHGWDIFAALDADSRGEGLIDDIRDLRRYLLLVEAEAKASGIACTFAIHRDNLAATKIQRYVVGLLFDSGRHNVILIHKIHGPKCVVGRWNGIGGHVEPNEEPIKAMIRECSEEAGVQTREHDWTPVAEISSGVAQVHFFTCENEEYFQNAHTCEDEEITAFAVENLPKVTTTLTWMIPWLVDSSIIRQYAEISMKEDPEI